MSNRSSDVIERLRYRLAWAIIPVPKWVVAKGLRSAHQDAKKAPRCREGDPHLPDRLSLTIYTVRNKLGVADAE